MSLKARLKPYILSLGLIFSLFSFSSVFAEDNSPFEIKYLHYNISNQLEAKIHFPANYVSGGITYDKVLFPDNLNYNSGSMEMVLRQGLGDPNWNFAFNRSTSNTDCMFNSYPFNSQVYCLSAGEDIILTTNYIRANYYGYVQGGSYLTKSEIDSWGGQANFLEGTGGQFNKLNFFVWSTSSQSGMWLEQPLSTQTFPVENDTPIIVNGTCGTDNNQDVSAEPTGSGACAEGTITDMLLTSNYLSSFYSWFCFGSGGGTNELCYAPMVATVNGTCGTADGTTSQYAPTEQTMCSSGFSGNSLSKTITGWTWSCYGNNNGTIDNCSQVDSGAGTLPTNPEEDCDTYSGIDKIVCNLSNTIQGMFLPSQNKLEELQTTINKVGNVFPFNYLRVIGTIFSNSTITNGGLDITLLGNTASLDSSFFSIPLFSKVRLFFTIMVLLMFTFWAINYIKNFFK